MNKFLFATVIKVDAATQRVWGRVTEEIVDKSKEILDYEGSKPLFQKWSGGFEKATGGKSVGNLRLMHKPSVAGKLVSIDFNDAEKAIDVCAHVVDADAWKLVDSGCITGFSMGGEYVKKWQDDRDPAGVTRFTAEPSEVSLVDNPCVPTALFTMVKADGVEVQAKFATWEPSTTDVGHRAEALCKVAGKGGIPDYMDAARAELLEAYAAKAMEAPNAYDAYCAKQGWTESQRNEMAANGTAMPDGAYPINSMEDLQNAIAAYGTNSHQDPAAVKDHIMNRAASMDGGTAALPSDWTAPAAKAAETTDWGLAQVWQVAADKTVHATKAAAKAHVEALQVATAGNPALAEALKAAKAALNPVAKPAGPGETKALAPALKDTAAALKLLADQNPDYAVVKGLAQVSRLAHILCDLADLQVSTAWESAKEGDSSAVPGALATTIKALADNFSSLASEELAELLASMKEETPEVDIMVMDNGCGPVMLAAGMRGLEAVKADTALMTKVGARHSAADMKRLQAMHDSTAAMGAKCDPKNAPADADKAVAAEEVQKLTAQRDALEKQIAEVLPTVAEMTKAYTVMGEQMAGALAKIAELEAQPAPMPKITEQTRESDGAGTPEGLAKALASMRPEEVQKLMMKAAQSAPATVFAS
jgi:hypothetical protein